ELRCRAWDGGAGAAGDRGSGDEDGSAVDEGLHVAERDVFRDERASAVYGVGRRYDDRAADRSRGGSEDEARGGFVVLLRGSIWGIREVGGFFAGNGRGDSG